MILKDKNIIVTGAMKGIGKETVRVFAKEGANIWACGLHYDNDFEEEMRFISEENKVIVDCVYFDISNENEVKEASKKIIFQRKRIDGLVNMAGITHNSIFQMTTINDFKHIFNVNVFGQVLFTQLILKSMSLSKCGSIIFVSSVSGLDGNYGQVAYSGSKSALIGITKSLSCEFSAFGIRVNCIAPGVIETDMVRDLKKHDYDKLVNRIISGRIGKTTDVSNLCAFLLSDLSSYVNGQVIRVDGFMR